MNCVMSGLDVLLAEEINVLKGKKVGILCNQTAVTHDLTHITDVLHSVGIKITALFGPEHGVRGDASAGASVGDAVDPILNIPAFSLFGATNEPTNEMLADIDILLIDVQDIGARFYTYPSTVAKIMAACGRNDIQVWVLDRPNPISGLGFEGPILHPQYSSFVGLFPIPVRHGFTTGELATLYRIWFGVECNLRVIKMRNWNREMWFDVTGLPWVMPSPNMPTLDTATVYPGTCFFEGTNVSEGRGTTRPFEIFGAPWIDAHALRKELMSLNLPGVMYREAYFIPFAGKFQNEPCAGLQLYVTDRKVFKPVLTGLAAVSAIHRLHPGCFAFKAESFDLLAGGSAVREMIEVDMDPREMEKTWVDDVAQFESDTSGIWLY